MSMNVEQTAEIIRQLRDRVSRVIVGQTDLVDHLLIALLADGHILLEGVPGVAKTLAARLTARLMHCVFGRIQFTPDLMPADVLGTNIFDQRTLDFTFRKGPVFANILLADEINRAPAKTQSALFEVMEERQCTVDGTSYPMPHPFMVIATQNPIEQEGTYRLPEAQLDRFLMKITIGYPSAEEEVEILRRHHNAGGPPSLNQVEPLLSIDDVLQLRSHVRSITVEESILTYIATIVQATRINSSLEYGGSPRASIGILSAAKGRAMLDGRDYVLPDDVQAVARPVLRHRVQLTPERELDGTTADDVIGLLLGTITVPR
jgi:MoxR-like ATPase